MANIVLNQAKHADIANNVILNPSARDLAGGGQGHESADEQLQEQVAWRPNLTLIKYAEARLLT